MKQWTQNGLHFVEIDGKTYILLSEVQAMLDQSIAILEEK